jgi:hypothetical protein
MPHSSKCTLIFGFQITNLYEFLATYNIFIIMLYMIMELPWKSDKNDRLMHLCLLAP